jgi:molybdopterin/thiamine biosynthesis adenylyltransferase
MVIQSPSFLLLVEAKVQRYTRNFTALSMAEQNILAQTRVCVIGCGGLGGYAIEMLGRIGIGSITVVDYDRFDATNLNRQLLADETTLACSKATTAQQRIKLINPHTQCVAHPEALTKGNAQEIIKGHHAVVDALDTIAARFVLQDACAAAEIPLIHGAIAGWSGHVCTILPGDANLQKIYPSSATVGAESELGVLSFAPAVIAGIQVSEVIKVILGRGNLLHNRLLYVDLLDMEHIEIEL